MRPLENALKYMEILFSDVGLDDLTHLLADDLIFNGALNQFNSAQYYINSKSDPPKDFHYVMIHFIEKDALVCRSITFQTWRVCSNGAIV